MIALAMSDCIEIGSTLRRTREERGWSLQDVTHRTRIPLLTLHALEQDDYSVFASPTYTRSFLSQYSDYLGLDATDWLESLETGDIFANLDSYEYLKDHDEHLSREPVKKKSRRQVASVSAAQEEAPVTTTSAAPMLQPLMIFAVTAVMITGAVFGFLHLSRSLADNGDDSGELASGPSTRDLKPIPTVADNSMAGQDLGDVPRAVAVPSSSTAPTLVVSVPPAQTSSAPRPAAPVETAPPRAIIIEE